MSDLDIDLSQSAEIEENAIGGKGSKLPVRCDLFPPKAFIEVAKVVAHGANKYGENNWRKVDRFSHLNHAITHIYAYLAEDKQGDHLSHAACRVMMALELELIHKGKESDDDTPYPQPILMYAKTVQSYVTCRGCKKEYRKSWIPGTYACTCGETLYEVEG